MIPDQLWVHCGLRELKAGTQLQLVEATAGNEFLVYYNSF